MYICPIWLIRKVILRRMINDDLEYEVINLDKHTKERKILPNL